MIINISPPPIPCQILAIASEYKLTAKTEFHLTVLPYAVEQNNPKLGAIARTVNWTVKFQPKFYLAQKQYEASEIIELAHARTTIVQLVACPEMDNLYSQAELPQPFAHVTLFTSHPHGIAILQKNDPQVRLRQL